MHISIFLLIITIVATLDVGPCSDQTTYSLPFTYIDGTPDDTTWASICHDSQHLIIRWKSIDNEIIAPYQNCNDPLYNGDAVQAFIATPTSYPYDYYELEVSPNSKLFFADIHNPTGDCSSLGPTYQDCANAQYGATLSSDGEGWLAWLQIRLDLIGRGQALTKFRLNLLRIDVSSTSATRFLTFRPTFANPPCFHVPAYFQEINLI